MSNLNVHASSKILEDEEGASIHVIAGGEENVALIAAASQSIKEKAPTSTISLLEFVRIGAKFFQMTLIAHDVTGAKEPLLPLKKAISNGRLFDPRAKKHRDLVEWTRKVKQQWRDPFTHRVVFSLDREDDLNIIHGFTTVVLSVAASSIERMSARTWHPTPTSAPWFNMYGSIECANEDDANALLDRLKLHNKNIRGTFKGRAEQIRDDYRFGTGTDG